MYSMGWQVWKPSRAGSGEKVQRWPAGEYPLVREIDLFVLFRPSVD